MPGAQGLKLVANLIGKRPLEIHCIERFPTNDTAKEFHARDLIPSPLHKMLEFHGVIGANPPAISTPRTFRHVVEQGSCVSIVPVTEGVGGAILDTGQAAITVAVDSKIRHLLASFAAGS